ncbi:Molybdopterin biosynthesis protein MoeA [[Actinomadura] parvosata subsp. kistnae]|uniref:Molybdopterin molybdenumtransferase n=1 Tax=[Actinomadura] parvosata subsp. kistnae TaxID=1909395 RepID=A0A1V0AEH1_9ACTN|nr:gephyrin-like molybdotransferase Glp [Nonomuraea sp. ATCC 55076]AQZ68607.1 molybdopterin molybdenumtransferase MoeA [Nonomuraea sp. ATCC 55076]SPL92920.1 Molybdopterin biosynthesis protein MoeA [Actinomadura parvosata subsp. kistnae]
MKSVDAHLAEILATVRPLAPLELELEQALGTTLAEDVSSPVPLPPFDNSAMDGYAVRAADLADLPATLPVIDDVAAGSVELRAVGPGHAVRIMTGAPLPAGADAVVPVEWTDGGTVTVRIDRRAEAGNAIRRAGEDVQAGEVVLRAGTVIGPAQLGIIAGVGRRRVWARPRPRVVVISTGAELVEPGGTLQPGQIWDSNSYTLTAAVREVGADGFRAGSVGDDPGVLLDRLDTHLVRADAIITSGGVSMGAYEPVKEALSPLGTVRFEKVAMQPGMPQGFGVLGDDQVPIFALPGNPVSSFVSFMLFVRPALDKMRGLPGGMPETVTAVTTGVLRSPFGRRSYLRGVLAADGTVSPAHGQGSHQLAALASANALIVVPEDVTEVAAGASVEVVRL